MRSINEPKDDDVKYFYNVVQGIATDSRFCNDNSALKKITTREIRGWLTLRRFKLEQEISIKLTDCLEEAILEFLMQKRGSKNNINDDKNWLFIVYRNTVFKEYCRKANKLNLHIRDEDVLNSLKGDNENDEEDTILHQIDSASSHEIKRIDLYSILTREDAFKHGGKFQFSLQQIISLYGNSVYIWKYDWIAEAFKCKAVTLRSDNLRARQKIRKFLEEKYGFGIKDILYNS
jgi:DNA-directed RNA polymerase specialized sigma24 family protein